MANLLIVDDDAQLRRTIAIRLSTQGHCVLQASDVDAALRILELRDEVDLLCTDIEMPGSIDGCRLAALASHARWPLMHIIVMSGQPRLARDLPQQTVFLSKALGTASIVAAARDLMARDRRADLVHLLRTQHAA